MCMATLLHMMLGNASLRLYTHTNVRLCLCAYLCIVMSTVQGPRSTVQGPRARDPRSTSQKTKLQSNTETRIHGCANIQTNVQGPRSKVQCPRVHDPQSKAQSKVHATRSKPRSQIQCLPRYKVNVPRVHASPRHKPRLTVQDPRPKVQKSKIPNPRSNPRSKVQESKI